MKVEKINSFFEKLGKFQVKHGKIILFAAIIWAIVSALGLLKFRFASTNAEWFLDTDIAKVNAEKFRKYFGNDDSVAVLVKADDVFNPRVLEMIKNLGDTLLEEVPFADRVTSIMEIDLVVGDEEGFVIENPFSEGIPENPEELKEKKDFILSRDVILNNLVSEDATETWVVLRLLPFEDLETDGKKVGNAVIALLERPEFHSDLWDLNAMGAAYFNVVQTRGCLPITIKCIIMGFFAMVFCLLIFTRSAFGVIIPMIATGCGIAVAFGWCGYLDIRPDSTLITLPMVLGMALSIGYSIHYINAFKLAFSKTGNKKEAAVLCVAESGWPIFFTVITTVASLLSFLFVPVKVLKTIGLICAAVIFSVYVYVVIMVPICLGWGKEKNAKAKKSKKQNDVPIETRLENFGTLIIKRHKMVIAIFTPIVILSIIGCFKIKVDMNYIGLYGKKLDFAKRVFEMMDSQIGNVYSYNVLIDFDEENVFKNPENIKKLDLLSDEIGNLSLTKITNGKPRVTSVSQVIKEMNRALNEDDKDFYCIPDDKEMLAGEMFLYEISGGNYLSEWLTDDYSKTYIHVELSDFTTNLINKDMDEAISAAQRLFPDAEIGIEGYAIEQATMNHKIVIGEIISIAISLVIIAILMILAFASFRIGLIGMIPNIVPILFIGGCMGIANLSMDVLTMMIMPMALGIAVDDTIHFMNHTKFFFEKCGNYKESILGSFREVGKSMLSTTLILCLMFTVYVFNKLAMANRLGTLAILGLSMALVADFTITPALIYITKPFGKETKTATS